MIVETTSAGTPITFPNPNSYRADRHANLNNGETAGEGPLRDSSKVSNQNFVGSCENITATRHPVIGSEQ